MRHSDIYCKKQVNIKWILQLYHAITHQEKTRREDINHNPHFTERKGGKLR